MKTLLLWFILACAAGAQAKLQEEVLQVPVAVQDLYGRTVRQAIAVTVFSDDASPRPAPVLLINHGRAFEAKDRAALGRARYGDASRFFVREGFIVAVPTRIGYGVTEGPDIEDAGSCDRRVYRPGYDAAASQVIAALEAVRQRPDAARDRAVVLGQSYGGLAVLGVAARNPEGVQAVINFAGGGGGNPRDRPQRPCATASLERLFAQYGGAAKIPSLWIYTENDQYFGPAYPREWHAAYTRAGGPAEFVQFPPHGEDGHALFTRFPQVWQPRVLEFLRARGLARP
jgi:dienelactone hydrolase